MAENDPPEVDIAKAAPTSDGLPRIPIYKSEPRGLTISDYEGRQGASPDRPSNMPSRGVDVPVDVQEQDLPDELSQEAALAVSGRNRAIGAARSWLEKNVPADKRPEPPLAAGDAASEVDPAAAAGAVAAVKDIARGIMEAPRQIVGGVRDAAQAAIDLGDWIADKAEEIAPLGGVQLFNDKGELKPEYIPPGDPRISPDKTGVKLPKVKEAKSATGGLVRGVSQFLTGFATAGGAIGAVAKTVPAARAAIQGGLANFVGFDAMHQRMSDLIEEHPQLANPVTAFLASSPDDNEATGRFKNAIEGLGLGVMTDGLIKAVKYIRDARRAGAAASETEQQAARAAAAPAEAKPMTLLGDAESPLLSMQIASVEHGVTEDVAAHAATRGKGLSPLTDGKQPVYVNFSKIDSPDDVKRVIADTTAAFKEDIDAARRGVRTNAQTMEAAGSVDAWEALTARRHGAPMNAEESLAARRLWEASAAKLLEVAEAASKSGAPEDLFQFRKMLAIHRSVQQEVIAARTETARALQAWSIPAGGGGAERLNAIESVLNAYGGSETAQLLASRVAALKRVPDGLSVLDGVAERSALVKSMGAAKEVWINMLLSNPQTHVVNIMGNAAGLVANMAERAVAARYSQVLGYGGIYPGEAAALAHGSRSGVREGLRLFVNALRTGESQFGAASSKAIDAGHERALTSTYFGMSQDNWMAKAVDGMGTVINQPVRFLSAEDDFFKSVAYRMEVQAQAFRQATREVQGGQIEASALNSRITALAADPPPNIRMEAADAALYLTYTQKPGKFVEAINSLDRKLAASGSPAGQIGSLAMRILIPFRNTPANLIKYSFERTPLAPLMQGYREAIAKGGADADIARTRLAMGTFTLLGALDLALDGHITGGGPKDDDDKGTRATLLRAGWQPYSIKIGDKYISYKRTDPFGLSIGLAADIAEMINNADLTADKAEEIGQVIAASAASFGNMVLDKTYMSSMSDFIDVLHNPRKAANFVERIGSSFIVPNVMTIPRRAVDPYTRYTHDLVTKLRDKIPGLSSSLPAARDMWGRARSFQSGMGEQYDAISPYYIRTFNPEPIDAEALKNDFNLTMPGWTLTSGKGVTVALRSRPEVYSRLLEVRGQMTPSEMGDGKDAKLLLKKYGDRALLPLLNAIVTGKHPLSAAYEAGSAGRNGGKDDMVTRIVGDYTRAAKAKVIDENPELAGIIEVRKEKKAAGQERSRLP